MKISERGQITIPKFLRDRFGLYKNVEVELTKSDRQRIAQVSTALQNARTVAEEQQVLRDAGILVGGR